MSWNYRVMRRRYSNGHDEFGIYFVYYNAEGYIDGMSLEPASVNSYSVEDLKNELDLMREALQKPVLDYEDESVSTPS